MATLQVFSNKYQRLAQENAVFKKTVYPARGVVYDRKGKAIINNNLMYDLMVIPSEAKGVDTSYVCQLLDIDTAEFRARMLTAIVKNGRSRASAFESLMSPEKHARLEENSWRLGKGFYLQERPIRTFPFGVGAPFIGYTGEVDSAIIARSEGFYQSGDYVGRSGLEATYEKVLMGQRGIQYLIKDNHNRLVGRFENGELDEQPVAGRSLHSYIDVELQQLAEKLMANKIGAIVAIDPKTGGIVAMASGPTFNANDLTGQNFRKTYGKFVLDVSRPLLNRAIKGQYPPGSTYKPIGALIGLDEGVITPRSGIDCRGFYYGCNRPVKCTEKWAGHAANLRKAIAHSCNSFFSMTYRLTVDNPQFATTKDGYAKWRDYMNAFGYGNPLGIDLPGEDKGNIPDTAKYNRVYRNSWNSCTNVTLGIGQDMMLATPLQIANAMSIIANKGYSFTPHIIKSIDGENADDSLLNPYRIRHKVPIHIPDTAYNIVIEGMHDVTLEGTAATIPKVPGIDICAKTGTAENFHNGEKQKDHSVFACFAPKENPQIAIAVIVENGGFGATWAGPMAYLLVEKYLKDSLRAERVQEADRIAAANLLPAYLPKDQYKADSIRAYYYFNLTTDSIYLKRFFRNGIPAKKQDTIKHRAAIATATIPGTPPQKRVPYERQQTGLLNREEWWENTQNYSGRKKETAS
ncbi:MAG: penicillin-binding transpeptidase domain-containing protein [Bacteroidota bacterium]|nr:penicillin-binding transpeptidase domain-containing protein [Bacteroidota bacterium]